MSDKDDKLLLNALARHTGRQYMHNLLLMLEQGETLLLGGMVNDALKQAAEDFDEWEAVPEAANYQGSPHWTDDDEEAATKIMREAVDAFVKRITDSDNVGEVELRKAFHLAVQVQISKTSTHLKNRVWEA